MRLGLHVCEFNFVGGPESIPAELIRIARAAEDAQFHAITVPDHVLQSEMLGRPDDPMLEAYSTLGYLAAATSRITLGVLVTSVVNRSPGLLVKMISTLDVLSGGRMMLGLGSAWNSAEAHALGLPFPAQAIRFELLEDTLQIARQMWSDNDGPFTGKHYHLAATLNSPQPVGRRRPPILIGGSGEQKTLRFVAKYGDASNFGVAPGPVPVAALARKLDLLRLHCEHEGRDYETIEKTALTMFNPSDKGAQLAFLRELRDIGFDTVHGIIRPSGDPRQLEELGGISREIQAW